MNQQLDTNSKETNTMSNVFMMQSWCSSRRALVLVTPPSAPKGDFAADLPKAVPFGPAPFPSKGDFILAGSAGRRVFKHTGSRTQGDHVL